MNGRIIPYRRPAGMTLIELLIAMVLGILISGAAISMFLANKQTYLATDGLARLQENARIAFELMARDLREAGGNPCQNSLQIANVLNTPTAHWWSDYQGGVVGYDGDTASPDTAFGTEAGTRVAGTDSIDLINVTADPVTVVSHDPATATLSVDTSSSGIQTGDLVLICDFDHAAIAQITSTVSATASLLHASGSGTPGNCSAGLGLPVECTAVGTSYEYKANAMVARLQPRRWFIGNNARGGRSLFLSTLGNTGGSLTLQSTEIAEGVEDLQLSYLKFGGLSYMAAGALVADDWPQVAAVRATLRFVPPASAITAPAGELGRSFEHVITLRNHVP